MNDDTHYDEVAKELQAKAMVPGLWAKAFAEAGGQVDRARALYIKYRVSQLAEAANDKLWKERRLAMEAAKQHAVSGFCQFAYALLCVVFTLLTFVCGLSGVIGLFTSSPETMPIGAAILLVILALLFGLVTYRCYKAMKKMGGRKQ